MIDIGEEVKLSSTKTLNLQTFGNAYESKRSGKEGIVGQVLFVRSDQNVGSQIALSNVWRTCNIVTRGLIG